MEDIFVRLRGGWESAKESLSWLQGEYWEDWGLAASLHSHCGVIRGEPSCLIETGGCSKDPCFKEAPRVGLPRITEYSERTSVGDDEEAYRGEGDFTGRSDDFSARSTKAGRDSDMPANDREKEKTRLQKLLKDFAKACVAGISVNVVNSRTGGMPPFIFQMDRRLSSFSLQPGDGGAVDTVAQDFGLQEVVNVYKGQEVCRRAPFLGLSAASCVGIDMCDPQNSLMLHFDDAYERDKFYTCLQVMKMSVDIQCTK